ncbi:MAG: hypothetical protein FWC33_00335 [Candidatus Bathyarchaeota archaeon]|nr:hypothetical protein [Candidatus Termiticorpusculum sp.]
MTQCKICSRPIKENGYCNIHLKAYQNICEKFETWNKALEVSWMDYLINISKNSLTGEWAKEVVKHLIEDGSRNVKEE